MSGPRKSASVKGSESKPSTDRVEFSAVLQEAGKTQGVKDTATADRAEKLASLKEQISNGTYRPSMEEVAASLIKFMGGEG